MYFLIFAINEKLISFINPINLVDKSRIVFQNPYYFGGLFLGNFTNTC